jgi:dolichyl-phosphate-mannose-protein mannosyltransferase
MSRLYKKIKAFSPLVWLFILLLSSFVFRINRLSTPSSYVFDEVYHVVTSRAYSQNNPEAYNPFSAPPEPNTAFDWLHPPLAKLIQASSIKLIGDSSFAWRFPSAIFGTLSIATLYYLALTLFNKPKLALLAATLFSLDGLQLTMSRITMNDIFVITFILLSLTFFYQAQKKRKEYLFLTGLFTGLALATKWSALFLYPIFSIVTLFNFYLAFRQGRRLSYFAQNITYNFIFLLVLPITIYILAYSQYFLLGYSVTDFINLHKQIYWYQTGLTATHDYQSSAWQWPLLLKPVWFHVKYTANHVANIYNLGNPAIFWGGLVALARFGTFRASSEPDKFPNLFLLLSYLLLFLPWLLSPRILFFHHFLPALPLLCLIIAKTIYPYKSLTYYYLSLTVLLFLFFYPLNTAIPLPSDLTKFWFWLPSWR